MNNLAPICLYEYQKDWVEDKSRFKIALKSRQTGFSFCSSLEAVFDCLERRTQWVLLSRGERQSRELMEKCAMHAKAAGAAIDEIKEITENFDFDKKNIKVLEIRFPNHSKILGLPANPDTARGFSANLLLDEFAFHPDSRKIWTALYPSVTRGYKVRVISTPNGKNNKFYDLWSAENKYSKHETDIYKAIQQGLPANAEELRESCDSDDTWEQEYCCKFIDEATAYITYDMITACESDQVTFKLPSLSELKGELYGGMDIGRKRDLTVVWIVEKLGDVYYTRMITRLKRTAFCIQKAFVELLIQNLTGKIKRFCIDSTGLGMQLAEEMQQKYHSLVEPVTFTNTSKADMAVTLRRKFEDRQIRIPIDRVIREDIHSIKKFTTSSGNVRYDAERSEAGHADHFWALALALHAGSGPAQQIAYRSCQKRSMRFSKGTW